MQGSFCYFESDEAFEAATCGNGSAADAAVKADIEAKSEAKSKAKDEAVGKSKAKSEADKRHFLGVVGFTTLFNVWLARIGTKEQHPLDECFTWLAACKKKGVVRHLAHSVLQRAAFRKARCRAALIICFNLPIGQVDLVSGPKQLSS